MSTTSYTLNSGEYNLVHVAFKVYDLVHVAFKEYDLVHVGPRGSTRSYMLNWYFALGL